MQSSSSSAMANGLTASDAADPDQDELYIDFENTSLDTCLALCQFAKQRFCRSVIRYVFSRVLQKFKNIDRFPILLHYRRGACSVYDVSILVCSALPARGSLESHVGNLVWLDITLKGESWHLVCTHLQQLADASDDVFRTLRAVRFVSTPPLKQSRPVDLARVAPRLTTAVLYGCPVLPDNLTVLVGFEGDVLSASSQSCNSLRSLDITMDSEQFAELAVTILCGAFRALEHLRINNAGFQQVAERLFCTQVLPNGALPHLKTIEYAESHRANRGLVNPYVLQHLLRIAPNIEAWWLRNADRYLHPIYIWNLSELRSTKLNCSLRRRDIVLQYALKFYGPRLTASSLK